MEYNQLNFNEKNINVGIIINYPYIYTTKSGSTDINDYKGILADTWKKIEAQNKNWNITYTFIKNASYTKSIELLAQGTYDILVGDISITGERSELIDFTHTVLLNRFILAYKTNYSDYFQYIKNAALQVIIPTAAITVITFTLGFLLYLVDPKKRFVDSIWQTISAVIGEPGALTVFTRDHYPSFLIILITLFVGFFFNILLFTITTSNYVNNKIQDDPFADEDLNAGKKILIKKNGRLVSQVKKFKMSPIVTDNDVGKTFFSKGTFDGFIENISRVPKLKNDYSNIGFSSLDLGFDEFGIAVNKNNKDLLDKLNLDITILKKSKELSSICKKYIQENSYLCEL